MRNWHELKKRLTEIVFLFVAVGCNANLYEPAPPPTNTIPVVTLTLLSTLTLTGYCASGGADFADCTDITKSGSYLYVADRHATSSGVGGQILILNAQDPTNPVISGVYNSRGVQGLAAVGSRLYTAGYFSTNTEILDLTNPIVPSRIGFLANNSYDKPAPNGNYVYSANYNGTLDSIDVSDPTNPTLVASVATGNPESLPAHYHNGYVYSSGKKAPNNLQMTNVVNPLNPIVLSSSTVGGNAGGMTSLTTSGNALFVTVCDPTPSNALAIYDISSPASPVRLSFTNLSSDPCDAAGTLIRGGVAIKDKFAFVGTDSMRLYDISNLAQPVLVATALPQELINAVFLGGRYLYALSGSRNALFIFDTGY